MENENKEKEYTAVERLKIVDRSEYIRTVTNKKDLKPGDIYVPVQEKGKTVYLVAVKD